MKSDLDMFKGGSDAMSGFGKSTDWLIRDLLRDLQRNWPSDLPVMAANLAAYAEELKTWVPVSEV